MNCFRNPQAEEETNRSLQIDKQLEQWAQERKKELKVVVMGTEGSGKSTVLKQIKLMHEGFSQEERSLCKPLIRDKIVESMRSQLEETCMLEHVTADWPLRHHAETVLNLPQDTLYTEISPSLQDALVSLWSDEQTRDFFARFHQHWNKKYDFEALKFYFDSVKHIAAEEYIPSDEDILRLYCPTKGVDQVIHQGDYPFRVAEVSRRNSVDRKGWIHQFDDANLLLFVVPVSEYDSGDTADNCVSRLSMAVAMFESIVSSPWFSKIPIIILFSHLDNLKEKLQTTPLNAFYPTYTGGSDMHAAAKFISDLFTQDEPSGRVEARHMNALDTYSVKWILAGFNDILIPPQPYTSRKKGP